MKNNFVVTSVEKESVFWLTVSKVSVHVFWLPLLRSVARQKHHGEKLGGGSCSLHSSQETGNKEEQEGKGPGPIKASQGHVPVICFLHLGPF